MTEIQIRLNKGLKRTTNGCLEWQNYKNSKGYGQINYKRKATFTHRIAWMIFNGEIPKGKFVLHHCDNPPCCEITHLFIGTSKDNTQDMVAKNRVGFNPSKGEKNGMTKITSDIAKQIKDFLNLGLTCIAISEMLNISKHIIYDINRNRTWRHI